MTDRWLTNSQAVDAIKQYVGSSTGHSEAILREACHSGQVRSRDDDRVLLMADDGIVGMVRPLQTKAGIAADGKLVTHSLASARNTGVTFSEEDLLDWLKRNHVQSRFDQPKQQGGAPEQYDWEEIRQYTFQQLDKRGDFTEVDQVKGWRKAADLYRAIEDHLSEENCPSLTQLKGRVPAIVDEWRAKTVGN